MMIVMSHFGSKMTKISYIYIKIKSKKIKIIIIIIIQEK